MNITLPIPGFASIVGFAVCSLSGDGIQLSPGAPPGAVQPALFLFGQLLVGDKLFHIRSSLFLRHYLIGKGMRCQINDL